MRLFEKATDKFAIATLFVVLATCALVSSHQFNGYEFTAGPTSAQTHSPSIRTPHRLVLSARSKKGLTVCGLQPGDKIDEVLQELPLEISAEEKFTSKYERRFVLSTGERRVLSLASDPGTGLITRVGAGLGIPKELSVERSGVVICRGGQSWSEARSALDPLRSSDLPICENDLELHLESVSPDRWIGVSLNKRGNKKPYIRSPGS